MVELRRPRVRGVEERFERKALPLLARWANELGKPTPELHLHGLAQESFWARALLRKVTCALGRNEAMKARRAFEDRYGSWYLKAVEVMDSDWDRMVTFYNFPEAHWQHLHTTNSVESPFASVRLCALAAKRFKRVDRTTALIWKSLTVAERRFRKLNAPNLLQDEWAGGTFEDGRAVSDQARKDAA